MSTCCQPPEWDSDGRLKKHRASPQHDDATEGEAYAAQPPAYQEPTDDRFEGIDLSAHCLEICARESIDMSVLEMLTGEEMGQLSFRFGDRKKIKAWQSKKSKEGPSESMMPSSESMMPRPSESMMPGPSESMMPRPFGSMFAGTITAERSEVKLEELDITFRENQPLQPWTVRQNKLESQATTNLLGSLGVSAQCMQTCVEQNISPLVLEILTQDEMKELSFCLGDRKIIQVWQRTQSNHNEYDRKGVHGPAHAAHPAVKTVERTSSFLAAVEAGDTDAVRALLACERVDFNAKNSKGLGAIHLAANYGHTDILRIFLATGHVNVNQATENQRQGKMSAEVGAGLTALHFASKKGHVEAVRLLLRDIGVNVNAQTTDGSTALFVAAMYGHCAVVALLLADQRVDVNAGDEHGFNVLHAAVQIHRCDILKVLLGNARVNVHARTINGATALFSAALCGHTKALALLLADKRIDVNSGLYENGFNALHGAAQNGHTEAVHALLADGRTNALAAQTDNGFTALHHASYFGHCDVLRVLLADARFNVDARTPDGFTPVYLATSMGRTDAAQLLLATSRARVDANRSRPMGGFNDRHLVAASYSQEDHCELEKLLCDDDPADEDVALTADCFDALKMAGLA